jgi:hypothetical protein
VQWLATADGAAAGDGAVGQCWVQVLSASASASAGNGAADGTDSNGSHSSNSTGTGAGAGVATNSTTFQRMAALW